MKKELDNKMRSVIMKLRNSNHILLYCIKCIQRRKNHSLMHMAPVDIVGICVCVCVFVSRYSIRNWHI